MVLKMSPNGVDFVVQWGNFPSGMFPRISEFLEAGPTSTSKPEALLLMSVPWKQGEKSEVPGILKLR